MKDWLKRAFPGVLGLRSVWHQARHRYRETESMRARFPQTMFAARACADETCEFAVDVVVGADVRLTKCKVGRNTYFSDDCRFHWCTVGAFCSIGPEVRAGLGRHPTRDFVSTHPSFYSLHDACKGRFTTRQRFEEYAPIVIGNDVWIGARAIVVDGVTIGDGAIVCGFRPCRTPVPVHSER